MRIIDTEMHIEGWQECYRWVDGQRIECDPTTTQLIVLQEVECQFPMSLHCLVLGGLNGLRTSSDAYTAGALRLWDRRDNWDDDDVADGGVVVVVVAVAVLVLVCSYVVDDVDDDGIVYCCWSDEMKLNELL